MTAASAAEWVRIVEAWIHPASLIGALLLPLVRIAIRKYRGKVFKRSYLVHDAMSGLATPSFIALCLLPLAPGLRGILDPVHLFLAGVLGIVFVLTEVVSPDGDEDDECKRAALGLCQRVNAAGTS